MLRNRVRVKKNHQEIDNKISVLEDICDRADIRISKLKYELSQLESNPTKTDTIRREDISLPTYQAVIKRIQGGKSIQEISKETGISQKEVEVLHRLIEASSSVQS